MRIEWIAALAIVLSLAIPPVFAGGVAFDVASIRVNTSGGEINNRPADEKIRIDPHGITMANVTLVRCLAEAYRVYDFQIGAPAWMSSTRYDIVAKTAGSVTEDQVRQMLQTLLGERFHLAFHREQKDLRVYSLTVGKRGYQLREAEHPGSKTMGMADGAVVFRGYSIGEFMTALSSAPFRLDRPVRDDTGLTGKYDFELRVSADNGGMKTFFEGMLQADGDNSSVIDLVQQQTGLRFTSKKASVEFLAVDGGDATPIAN